MAPAPLWNSKLSGLADLKKKEEIWRDVFHALG